VLPVHYTVCLTVSEVMVIPSVSSLTYFMNRTRNIVRHRYKYATIALCCSVIIFIERIQYFCSGIEIKLISG
jgi:hypothetical protein